MSPDLHILLRSYIAKVLKTAAPYMMREDQLFDSLCAVVLPKPLRSEFDTVIARMDHARQIIRVRDDIEGTKCKLTEIGEAELCR